MVEGTEAMEAKVVERPETKVEAPAVPKETEQSSPTELGELKFDCTDVNLWYGGDLLDRTVGLRQVDIPEVS
jgi:hypothetical protein